MQNRWFFQFLTIQGSRTLRHLIIIPTAHDQSDLPVGHGRLLCSVRFGGSACFVCRSLVVLVIALPRAFVYTVVAIKKKGDRHHGRNKEPVRSDTH